MNLKNQIPIDPEIAKFYDWLKSFIPSQQWDSRMLNIEKYLEAIFEAKQSRAEAKQLQPVAIYQDKIAWYLYLTETYLYNPFKHEPIQGARVMPIFKRFGIDFNTLLSIKGVSERVSKMLLTECSDPDSVLFELLTALLWVKNGCNGVEFIPEGPPEKRPDLRAISNNEEWYIECKRLNMNSEYSQKEREKWIVMWRGLADFLIDYKMPLVFDIIFHEELETLPDDFLVKELLGKLKLVNHPCEIISNEIWSVKVGFVDFKKIHAHLKRYYVKSPSSQLSTLIGGKYDPNRGFTYIVYGKDGFMGEGVGSNQYLDKLDFAAGAYWSCDAERSIEKKARDIRGRLSSALEQLPEFSKCVIHVGLETPDGPLVEKERYKRIFNTVQNFDSYGKKLEWVYCNLFQSYSPPGQDWVMDETVYYFGKSMGPLKFGFMIMDDNEDAMDGVHWLRDIP
jgi:hypothetical protein